MSKICIKSISSEADFRALKPQWDRLVEQMDGAIPFASHDWFSCWAETFGKAEKPVIFTGWLDGELIGGMPMIETIQTLGRIFRFRGLQSMGNTESPGFGIACLPSHRTEFFSALQGYLAEHSAQWDILFLVRVQADSGTFKDLDRVFSVGSTRILFNLYPGSYLLKLEGDFDAYFHGLNKSFAKNRRHGNNKLARLGKVEFKHASALDPVALFDFFRLESSGWKKDTSVIALSGMQAFYEKISATFGARDQYGLWTLYLDGKAICSILSLVWRGTFYFLKIGVDYEAGNEVQKTSPGQALLFHVIRDCFEQKLNYFDFCGPFYEYERMWTNHVHQKQNVLILNHQNWRVRIFCCLKKWFGRRAAPAGQPASPA